LQILHGIEQSNNVCNDGKMLKLSLAQF